MRPRGLYGLVMAACMWVVLSGQACTTRQVAPPAPTLPDAAVELAPDGTVGDAGPPAADGAVSCVPLSCAVARLDAAALTVPRASAGVAETWSRVYVIGGETGAAALSSVEVAVRQ